MADQLVTYENYARDVKRLLLFAGLWPGRDSSKYFRIFVVVHVLATISTNTGIMNFVVNHITNLGLATKGLGVAVSFFTILLKVVIFTFHRENLMTLHEILDKEFQKDLSNLELRPVLLSPLRFFYRPTMWLTTATWAIVAIYFVGPPISVSIQLSKNVHPVKVRLLFPTEYPWDVADNGFLFPIHYIVETLAGFALAGVTTATDALFGLYIFQMSSQFRTLSYRMTNLTADDNYHDVMKECATRHRTLMICRDYLETIYGPIVLWMLLTSAMVMCANIFQASQISFDKAMLVLVYILMKLMQTLLYGWYGLFLTTESEAFRDSVYCSGWPGCGDRSFMSNILIMLMYKPLVLTACHFSVISLDMFMAITNTALSYFFLLRTLEDGK